MSEIAEHTEHALEVAKAFESQLHGLMEAVGGAGDLDGVFEQYGIDPMPDFQEDSAAVESVDLKTLGREMCPDHPAVGMDLVYHTVERTRSPRRPGPCLIEHDSAVGVPGTPISDGRLQVETNSRYSPQNVRGYMGEPKLYEQFYRSEPVTKDAIDTNTETLVSGTFEVQMPRSVNRSQASAVEEWTKRAHTKVLGIGCKGYDFSTHIEHQGYGLQKCGFATSEVVWASDEKGLFPNRIEPRMQATVDKWMLDERMDRLTATSFDPGTNGSKYILTHEGPSLTDYKLFLANVAAEGNNFEGVSPERPTMFYVKLKQLLLQIAGVGIEGFGVPIKTITEDPAALKLISDGLARDIDDKKRQEFFNIVKRIRAVDKNTFTVPFGLALNILSTQGSFPQVVLELLQYLDIMIAMPFSNEGSFLGLQSSVGSYALGDIKDKQDLQSSFYYARNIARPWNRLLKVWAQHDLGDLPAYPTLGFRLDGLADGSRWLEDMVKIFPGVNVTKWPEAARRAAEQKLDLEEGALEPEEQEGDTTDNQLIYKITNALGNGAMAITPELIRYIHAVTGAPEPTDQQVQDTIERFHALQGAMPAQGSEPDQVATSPGTLGDIAQALFDDATRISNAACEHHHELDHAEVVELHMVSRATGELTHEAFDADDAAQTMDKAEAELGRAFRRIAREMQDAWREEFKTAIETNDVDPDEVQAAIQAWRKEWMPRFREEADRILGDVAGKAIEKQLGAFTDVGDFTPSLDDETKAQVKLWADSAAREAYNRTSGMLADRMGEFQRGENTVGLAVPKAKTFTRDIGGRVVSSAFNRGRTQVQTAIKAEAEFAGLDGQALAERSSVLDGATCEICEKLDGITTVVGSSSYYKYQPPNKCKGKGRCRCIYLIVLDDEEGFQEAFERIKANGGTGRLRQAA